MRPFFDWLEAHKSARKVVTALIFFGPLLIYIAVTALLRSD